MVGDRHGRHVKFFDSAYQALDGARAIEQGIISVQMEMDGCRLRHAGLGAFACYFYFMRLRRWLRSEESVEKREKIATADFADIADSFYLLIETGKISAWIREIRGWFFIPGAAHSLSALLVR